MRGENVTFLRQHLSKSSTCSHLVSSIPTFTADYMISRFPLPAEERSSDFPSPRARQQRAQDALCFQVASTKGLWKLKESTCRNDITVSFKKRMHFPETPTHTEQRNCPKSPNPNGPLLEEDGGVEDETMVEFKLFPFLWVWPFCFRVRNIKQRIWLSIVGVIYLGNGYTYGTYWSTVIIFSFLKK